MKRGLHQSARPLKRIGRVIVAGGVGHGRRTKGNMADWSHVITCRWCGKGNPGDGSVCVNCHRQLRENAFERLAVWLLRPFAAAYSLLQKQRREREHKADDPWARPIPGTLKDELFGELSGTVDGAQFGLWSGSVDFHGTSVEITICGNESGPAREAAEIYRQLRDRYPALKPAIEKALYDECREWVAEAFPQGQEQLKLIGSPSEIWSLAKLRAISIAAHHGTVELWYIMKWSDCHQFTVEIREWAVTGASVNG